jgi:leucyl-tRNA synthetase
MRHIGEELWEKLLGHAGSISFASFQYLKQYLVESSKEYPISFNGKMRFT